MTFTIGFIIGCIVEAAVIYVHRFVSSTFGTISVDWSDPEKSQYHIVIDNAGILSKKKWLELKIDKKQSKFSQK